jgi:hypothetical protein
VLEEEEKNAQGFVKRKGDLITCKGNKLGKAAFLWTAYTMVNRALNHQSCS